MLATDTILCFEGYHLDRARCTLAWGDEPIVVTRRSFELLTYLAENPDRLLTKDALLDAVWPDQFVEESNLTQHVFLLRKALSRHGGAKLIETVPGQGYRFRATVEEQARFTEPPPSFLPQEIAALETIPAPDACGSATFDPHLAEERAAPHSRPMLPLPGAASRHRSRLRAWIAGIAVVLAAAAGFAMWQRRHQGSGAPVQAVLIPVEGSTGDAALDVALGDAVRIDLLQSPWITLVPSTRLQLTLQRMQRDPATKLDLQTAQEVCERTNSQAVIQSRLARVGSHFLFTTEAIGCVNGDMLAAAREEARSPEKLPAAIADATGTLRRKLGESRSSVERFRAPIVGSDNVNAGSLEALELDSQAKHLLWDGKADEAVVLAKRAVAIDPKFADGWYTLYAAYGNGGDGSDGVRALKQAYALRDGAAPMLRIALVTAYDQVVRNDLHASERDFKNWIDLYPRSTQPFSGYYNTLSSEGKVVEAEPFALLDLQADGERAIPFINGANAELAVAHFDKAEALCRRAFANGYDDDSTRQILLRIGLAKGDPALVQEQWNWLDAHPNSRWLLTTRSDLALSEGRFADARRFLERQMDADRASGHSVTPSQELKTLAFGLYELGETRKATAIYKELPQDDDDVDNASLEAMLGDHAKALRMLGAIRAAHPDSTVVNEWVVPAVRARIALLEHRPTEALALLKGTEEWNFRTEDLRRLRAQADLDAGSPRAAEAEYRDVIAHPEIDPSDLTHTLAWLGLGRALAAENRATEAQAAYRTFLARWAHADPDAQLLQDARKELADLER